MFSQGRLGGPGGGPRATRIWTLARSVAAFFEALGQFGSHQPLETQILDANPVVVLDQAGRQLVEKVALLVGGFLVDLGDGDASLGSPLASRLGTGEFPLGSLELSLSLAEELRSRSWFRAVREGCEVDQPQVDADHLLGGWQRRVGHLELSDQGDVPAAQGVPPERGGFRRQVHIHRLEETDLADLGNDDVEAFDLDPLGNAEPKRITLPGS